MSALPKPEENAVPAESASQEKPPEASRAGGHAELKALEQDLSRQADAAMAASVETTKSWAKRAFERIFGGKRALPDEPAFVQKLQEKSLVIRADFARKAEEIVSDVSGASPEKREPLKISTEPSDKIIVDAAYAKEAGMDAASFVSSARPEPAPETRAAGPDAFGEEKLVDLDELIGHVEGTARGPLAVDGKETATGMLTRMDAAHEKMRLREGELESMLSRADKAASDPDEIEEAKNELKVIREARQLAGKQMQAGGLARQARIEAMGARVDAAMAKEDAEQAAGKPASPADVYPNLPKPLPGSRPPGVPDSRTPNAPEPKPDVEPPLVPPTAVEAAAAVVESATETVAEAAAAEIEKTPEKAMASATGTFRARFMRDIPNLTLGGYREDLAFELPRLTDLSGNAQFDLTQMRAMDPQAFLDARLAKKTVSPEDYELISADPKLVAEYHGMAVKMATDRLTMIDKFLAGVPKEDMDRAAEADDMVDDILESGKIRDPKKAFQEAWKMLKARETGGAKPVEASKEAPKPKTERKPAAPKAETPAAPPERPVDKPAAWKSLEASGKEDPFAADAMTGILAALNESERSYKTVGTFIEGLQAAGYGFPTELSAPEINKRVKELYKAYKEKKGRA